MSEAVLIGWLAVIVVAVGAVAYLLISNRR
jgi:hypothetical protein